MGGSENRLSLDIKLELIVNRILRHSVVLRKDEGRLVGILRPGPRRARTSSSFLHLIRYRQQLILEALAGRQFSINLDPLDEVDAVGFLFGDECIISLVDFETGPLEVLQFESLDLLIPSYFIKCLRFLLNQVLFYLLFFLFQSKQVLVELL